MASLPRRSRMPDASLRKKTHTPTKESHASRNDRPKAKGTCQNFRPFVMLLMAALFQTGAIRVFVGEAARTGRLGRRAATIMPLDSTPRNLRGARLTPRDLRPIKFLLLVVGRCRRKSGDLRADIDSELLGICRRDRCVRGLNLGLRASRSW